MEYISKNIDDTINIAKKLSLTFTGGEIVLLDGDLGAGKTAFTKGLAQGLNIQNIITSPTFTILNVHEGTKLNLYHFDMYRLEDEQELKELGFEQYIGNKDGICAIEWYQKTPSLFENKKCMFIDILKIDDNTRKIIIKE